MDMLQRDKNNVTIHFLFFHLSLKKILQSKPKQILLIKICAP